MAASEKELGTLHVQLTKVMCNSLTRAEDRAAADPIEIKDEDDQVIDVRYAEEVNPALLNAIKGFLKDNEVTMAAEEGDDLDELRKQAKRSKSVGGVPHLKEVI